MKVLLLNPSHPSIGSRIPVEHLPPLDLLAIGGPLLDAEFGPLRTAAIVAEVRRYAPPAGVLQATPPAPVIVALDCLRDKAWSSG